MYFFITEDGEVFKGETVTDDDKHACDAGILEIVNTEDATTYHDGQWHPLRSWDELRQPEE